MEPIAVVGLDLKFPGDATDPSAFFDMLMSKRSALKEIPKDRFNLDAFSHPDPERAGTLHIRNAHFLKEDISAFDAPFFSITSAEAAGMDPQQRGLLESTYRALENAGMSLSQVNGSDAGVFIGCSTREYEAITFKDPELNLRYFATGMGTTMLANRLSFFYDLHGPSVTLDTACSSSLTACHLACSALRQRECSWAIVGGCNLFYSPDTVIPLTSLGFLSPEGKCYSFDHRANGYSRGEGFGVLVLKRFTDAIRDGDTIRAIIRGSSSNQDGKSPGITQPTPQAQMDLIHTAYKNAGLGLEYTRYFEAHGTGTPVGDPIEARAIGGVFSQHRSKEEPMYVGALKTNVGHLEGSAGIAGLLKAILVLERGIIPPNIDFEKPNPKIPVDEWGIKFPTDACFWPGKGLRRASINAFGYGGSNAHVILDDALHYMASLGLTGNHRTVEYPIPVALDDAANGSSSAHANSHMSITARKRIFVFSSFDEAGAERLATTYAERLKQIKRAITEEQTYLDDLSYTLSSRRSVFPWKFSAIADNLSALIGALESKPSPIRVAAEPKLGLVFTGQGARWHAMGRELLSYPVFEQSLAAADKFLRGLGCSWSLREELLKEQRASAIDNPAYSQPICTALQVALVELLKYSGVKYSAVTGHSSGELGAAYATGGISCESAWKLSYFRGILSAKLAETSDGTMMTVGLNQEDAISYIEKTMSSSEKGTIVVACVNSLCNVTVSGKRSSIALLKAALDRESIRNQQLRVENAYHSPYMETIADTYRDSIQNIHPGELAANVSFYSSLTGTLLPLSELRDPNYWVQNLVSPVLFSQALTHMLSGTASKTRKLRSTAKVSPITELLEVGPHSALRGPIREITERGTKKLDVAYESLLRRGLPADTTTLSAIGWLHCRGHHVKLGHMDENASANLLVDLPSYPFNHTQSYWNESRLSKGYRFRNTVRHELLGAPVPDWNPKNAIWRNYIRVSKSPWIKDHRITGSTIYPAAGMLVMAIEAARQVANSTGRVNGFRIRDVKFSIALRVPLNATGIETHFWLRPCHDIPSTSGHTWREFYLSSFENDEWREHCRGYIITEYEIQACPVDAGLEEALFAKTCTDTIGSVEDASTHEVSFKQMYEHLSTVGLDFGPAFQTMRNIRHGYNHEAVATIVAPDIAGKMPHGYVQPHLVHPTTLDGILQSIILALTKGGRDVNQVMVPSEIRDLWISAGPEAHFRSVRVAVQAKFLSIRQAEASITCLDNESFRPTATVDGFQVTQVAKNEGSEESVRRLCFNIDWKPDPSYFTQETANTLIGNSESSGEVARMRRLIEDVETICFLYIKRYLNSHPNPEVIGSTEPHHKKYVEWMKYQANRFDVGEIPHGQRVWLDQASDESHIVAMEERLESSSAEGKLCVAVGRALSDILAGKADALALMFNDKLVENVYRYSAGAEIGYERMNMYIDTLAHKNPALKILEIGAGTGGATKPLLQCLTSHGDNEKGTPRFSRYDFTDISIGFFEKAKEMFAETADRMTFRALNAEGDLTQQGFDKEQYDVIIAANVVHATKNLEATLSNVRKMMKPGGKLILYEMTNTHMIRTGFAFGLLPGWWLSDEDFRYWGPLASPKDWSRALKMSGFSGVDIDFFDFPDEKSQLVSVLVATAAGAETNNTSLDDSLAIILEKDSRIQIDLAGSLEAVLKQRSGVVPSLVSVDEVISTDLSKSLCFFLPDLEASFLENLDEKTHEALQQLTHSAKSLFWLNQGGGPSPRNAKADLVTGFARTIRAENPMMKFVTLSFDEIVSSTSAADIAWKIASTCFKKGVGQSSENALYEKDSVIYIGRITEANGMNEVIAARSMIQKPLQEPLGAGRPLALSIGVPELLDTLQFQDDLQCNQAIGPEEVEVEIKATGLNLLDTLVALGQVQGKAFGHEGAGIISKAGNASPFKPGDRVCGLVRGTFNTFARSSHQNWSKIPDNLSFTSAVAIPVVYGTAYYALHDIARIQKGETVLVHWGAGGVGQAAIQLASLAGANLIVTVGSLEKRDFIRDTYGIPEINILASRDLTFAQGVMRLTQGRGVDIVINSMSGQGLRSSWECIAQFGRFVEIGKVDIYSSNSLPMSPFKKNVTFAFIDVGLIAYENGSVFNRVLRDVLQLAHAGKIAEPRPLHLFSYSQIQEAFRIMQTGSHIGKFVLEPHKDDIVPIVPSSKPSYYFKANATYLITGGMGGLGRSMARWMASRGARNLILLSRSGIDHPAARDLLADMDATGVTVAAPKCDVSNKALLQSTLADCLKVMPPIRGAILGAMTLKDTTYAKMSIEDYQTAVVPKVRGSWNVHDLLPKDLDFFILLSSASGVVGNFGQSNYCVGNTYQDALARHRVAQGLKAASVDLGMILSVGFAAENQDTMAHLRQAGFNAMREGEFLAMLDALCNPNLPPPNPISSQIAIGIEAPEAMRIKGIDEPPWMQDPLFKQLFQIRTGTGSGNDANKDGKKYGVMLSTCTTDEEATNVVTDAIVQKLCKALSTTAREIDIKKPLHAYGVDSLVAVELRTWFAKEIAAEVAVFDIMGGSSLQQLAMLAARRSSLVQIASKEESVIDC